MDMTPRQQYVLSLIDELHKADIELELLKEPRDKAQIEFQRCCEEYKSQKEVVDKVVAELKAAREPGAYQPSLFDAAGDARKPTPGKPDEDPGKMASIRVLGLSDWATETLINHDFKTVADLEKAMREDPQWYRKIKRFGQSRIDELTDALLKWRQANPVPDPKPTLSPADEADPRIKDGVYIDGIQKFKITIPEKLAATSEIHYVQTAAGTWLATISAAATGPALGDMSQNSFSEPLSPAECHPHATREDALVTSLERLVDWWNGSKTKRGKAVAKSIWDFREFMLKEREEKAAEAAEKPEFADNEIGAVIVPEGKAKNVEMAVRLVQAPSGKWHGGIVLKRTSNPATDFAHPMTATSPPFETREEAIEFYLASLISNIEAYPADKTWLAAIDDVKAFQKSRKISGTDKGAA